MAAEILVSTFQDAVEHLLDRYDLPRSGRNLRLTRAAVISAYRDLPGLHRWTYYNRQFSVSTDASYGTGTIEYDHTGGTYERQLTLTGGTWPTNAAYGKVEISGLHYKVDSRKSSTVVTLSELNCPGDDITSGTSYNWYRESYALHARVRRFGPVFESNSQRHLAYLGPDELLDINISDRLPGTPSFFTFTSTGEEYGRMYMVLSPPPSTALTYEFMAEVQPRPLRIEKYSAGVITSSGASITGADGTSFSSDMVGAILRFSSDPNQEPTSLAGSTGDDADGIYNPYVEYRKITAVSSTTSLTVDSAPTTAVTSSRYTISDPLDIDEATMLTLLYRLSESQFAKLSNSVALPESQALNTEVQRQLIAAMGADGRHKDLRGPIHREITSLGDLDTGNWSTVP